MARVRRPRVREKLAVLPSGRTEVLGLLDDGATWDGPTREGYAGFDQTGDTLDWYLERGHLWHPAAREHAPWDTTERDEFRRPIDLALYSRFQVWDLERTQAPLTMTVLLDGFAGKGTNGFTRLGENLGKHLDGVLNSVGKHPYDDGAAFVAQALASRYYPQTQGDRRTITVSAPLEPDEWDWWEYARSWEPRARAEELGVTPEDLREYVSHLQSAASWADPMEPWYDLVQFIRVDERARLKGDARRAQDLYAMEHMGRLFFAELTGSQLSPPDEDRTWTRESVYGPGTTSDPRLHLEYVANRYHLNPRPRLLLVVEGESEAEQLPRILHTLLDRPASVLGIEIRPLRGIDEFVGRRSRDRYGALEKLIDDHHHRGTPVVIVLDRENDAPRVAEELRRARSRLNPERRLTRPEYIHLWERSIEFDNFKESEIATALTTVAGDRTTFTEAEVKEALSAYDRGEGDPLAALYWERLNYGLSKPRLLTALVDQILARRPAEFDERGDGRRPVVQVMQRVAQLAATNTFPISQRGWEENQASGFFGDQVEASGRGG